MKRRTLKYIRRKRFIKDFNIMADYYGQTAIKIKAISKKDAIKTVDEYNDLSKYINS